MDLTAGASNSRIPSASRARGQSRVSAMLGSFLDIEPAQTVHKTRNLALQLLVHLWHLQRDNLRFQLNAREIDIEVETATFGALLRVPWSGWKSA